MKADGLVAKKTKQFRVSSTDSSHGLPVADNLLDQVFTAGEPDQVWVGDITQIRTVEGWLYLAVLIDLYSRRVVGWATSTTINTELCLRALDRAVETRQPSRGLVHHSDRGSQYASSHYQERLQKLGFRCSMSRKGNCYDNAVAESFFDSLKTERWDRAWHSNEAAHVAAMGYIDGFYNLRRLHSTLGYLSPDDFERHAA
jgi:transposase InsO family protein